MWHGPDGRRVKRKLGTARTAGRADGLTKPQAEERLRELRAESGLAVVGEARRVTLEVAGAEYCRRLEVNNAKKSYRLTQAADLRNHLVPHFAGKTLDRIEVRDVERYMAAKQSQLALKTIRNHVNTLHSIFELGIKQGWCSTNPAKLADRPRIRRTETRIRFLDLEELDRLVSTPYPEDAWGHIELVLYVTAAMTGLRQGELLALRWRDVDFKSRRIRVVANYVRGEFDHPKSEESARSVPMGRRVEEALAELRSRSHYSHDRDLVFAHPETGKPLDRSKLSRRYNQAIGRAEVPRVTFHELRHTFGTTMAKAGSSNRKRGSLARRPGALPSRAPLPYRRPQPASRGVNGFRRLRWVLYRAWAGLDRQHFRLRRSRRRSAHERRLAAPGRGMSRDRREGSSLGYPVLVRLLRQRQQPEHGYGSSAPVEGGALRGTRGEDLWWSRACAGARG